MTLNFSLSLLTLFCTYINPEETQPKLLINHKQAVLLSLSLVIDGPHC